MSDYFQAPLKIHGHLPAVKPCRLLHSPFRRAASATGTVKYHTVDALIASKSTTRHGDLQGVPCSPLAFFWASTAYITRCQALTSPWKFDNYVLRIASKPLPVPIWCPVLRVPSLRLLLHSQTKRKNVNPFFENRLFCTLCSTNVTKDTVDPREAREVWGVMERLDTPFIN